MSDADATPTTATTVPVSDVVASMPSTPLVTVEEKLAKARELKEEGNSAFIVGDTKKALAKYTKVTLRDATHALGAIVTSMTT
jgi:predicted solute-binding protein